jgi:hypothetical protein
MVHDRVLTLVLSGGVEAFPTIYPLKLGVMGELCVKSHSPRHVMVTASCLLGKLGQGS